MNRKKSVQWLAALGLVIGATGAPAQDPMGSQFTYQGVLKLEGQALNNSADFVFTLWDSDGVQVGDPVRVDEVEVVEGRFTVSIDFGVDVYNGDARLLEIAVRSPHDPDDVEPFVMLTPRQPITATPYALQTRGLFTDAAGNVTIDEALRVGRGISANGVTLRNPNNSRAGLGTFWDANVNAWHFRTSGSGEGAIHGFQFSKQGARTFTISRDGNTSAFGFLESASDDGTTQLRMSAGDGNGHINLLGDGSFRLLQNGAPRITMAPGGDVGIGTDSPQAKLHIAGTPGVDGIMFPDGTLQTSASGGGGGLWQANGDDIHNANTGNVGIGTTTPEAPLHIVDNVQNADLILESTNGGTTDRARIFLKTAERTWFLENDGNFDLFKIRDGTGGDRLTIDVNGRVTVAILQITGGGDIAEPFEVNTGSNATGKTAPAAIPGMVVSIDPKKIGELRICDTAYDSTVAGIISGAGGVNPGMILKQEGSIADGTHPVALTGRVWAYCDADAAGSIQPGDLLTTSGTPGHAMKAANRDLAFGSILGKAMSPLDSGKGLVLVLVSLQ